MPHLLYKAGATMTAHANLARRCGRLNARMDQENMFLLPMSKRMTVGDSGGVRLGSTLKFSGH
jgi:hypothetical protein